MSSKDETSESSSDNAKQRMNKDRRENASEEIIDRRWQHQNTQKTLSKWWEIYLESHQEETERKKFLKGEYFVYGLFCATEDLFFRASLRLLSVCTAPHRKTISL